MPRAKKSSQKLLPRKPRVQIEYDVEIGDAIRKTELPWITAVMGDFSGANASQLPELEKRSFGEVNSENFDEFLKSQQPRVQFAVDNVMGGGGSMGVDVTFASMDDFSPDQLARKIGAEIEEVQITEVKEGRTKSYKIKQDGPVSQALGEEVPTLDTLSVDYVASKLGVKPAGLEVNLVPDVRDSKKHLLQVIKKGHLAKLLDSRNQLKEFLSKIDGKRPVENALAELLQDQELMREVVGDGDGAEE